MHYLTVSPSLILGIHNSIQFLPADRYQTARRYEMMATHLPTSEAAQSLLLTLAEQFGQVSEKEAERDVLHNIELGKRLAADNFYPERAQWAVLVATENGNPITDYSEDALLGKLGQWMNAGLTPAMIDASLNSLWEGIKEDLARYFPGRYGQNRQRNFLESYRQMLLKKLDHTIADTADSLKAYHDAIRTVLDSQKPARFSGANPVTLEMELSWQRLQVYASEGGCSDARNLTVIEMYTWLDNIEAKQEAQKQALRKNGHKR